MRGRYWGPEPVTKSGAPLLTHNHVMLLQALLDRPDGTVGSYREWIDAALARAGTRHGFPSVWSLRRGIRTVNAAWVTRRFEGSRIVVALTDRARAILDGRVAAHVRGVGPYQGSRAPRARRSAGSG